MKRPTGEFVLLAVLVALALGIRFYRIGWGLPGVYEEAMPFSTAWEMWGWGPDRHFDPNPHFFTYPSLTVYLQFLGQGLLYLVWTVIGKINSTVGFRVHYELDRTPFFLVGRSIGALLGAATVLPTYFLARRAGGRAAAVPAALLVAMSPLLIARSQMIEVDVPLTFFVTLTCVYALRMSEAATRTNCIAAGLAAGLATSCKYPGLLALLPALAASLLALRSGPAATAAPPTPAPVEQGRRGHTGNGRRQRADRPPSAPARPRSRPESVAALGQIAVLLAAFAIVLFATSPFVFLDAGAAGRELSMAGKHMLVGHFGEVAGHAWIFYGRNWVSDLMGLPLGLASLAGLMYFTLWRRSRWAIVLSAFFVPYAVFVCSLSRAANNYVLPLMPLGVVFATGLVANGIRSVTSARPAAWRIAGVALATALFAAPLLVRDAAQLKTLDVDSRAQAKAWIEAQVPSGALIATEVLGPELVSLREMMGWDSEMLQGLESSGYRPKIYGIEYIAMTTIYPERSAPFYDLRLYEPADYIVVTGAVRDRYLADPARFRPQIAFYEGLKRSWVKVQEIPSSGMGCDIVIYKNPAHALPFASRPPGPMPRLEVNPDSPLSGEEQTFYYIMAFNYEGFGFLAQAITAYAQGLRFASIHPERYTEMARRLAGCLVRQQRVADALAFLNWASRSAPTAREAMALRQIHMALANQQGSASPPR